jgi:SAM-dependent methyltransferase
MDERLYEQFYAMETTHWWFVARREILLAYLAARVPPHSSTQLLDVGCGTGAILGSLSERYGAAGIDASPQAVAFCLKRGLPRVSVGNLADIAAGVQYEVITLLDVIEHIDDDLGVLRDAHVRLRDNGRILITVPAFPSLWSVHDELNHHKRRYTRSGLRHVVSSAGFEVMDLTYFNTLLFPVALLRRYAAKLTHARTADDLVVPSPTINDFLKKVFSIERYLLPRTRLPFGLSLLCWAKKSERVTP